MDKSVNQLVLLLTMILCGSCTTTEQIPTTRTITEAMTTPMKQSVIVIQGIFDATGEKLVELKPVHLYVRQSEQVLQQPIGIYEVRVIYSTEKIETVPFDALVADDQGRLVHGFFEVSIPVSGDISYILITTQGGEKIFARINNSEIIR